MYTCGGPCYLFDVRVSAFDKLAHIFVPVVGTIFVSSILLWRIIRQKQRIEQQNTWKNNRRITWQILSVCCLHTVAWGPIVTIMLMVLFSPVSNPGLVHVLINWFPCSYFLVILIYPFICLIGLTKIWLDVCKSLRRQLRLIKNTAGLE
ncbi:unnamed protein product [Rotaria magnacalcarata]|uniref:G-protein coupled receptors family 1 profile domain-containing protein n=1 Tax=Rotaria magnacalcarata TaxID=392030 RepID=A0A816GAC7_9BILA|nr:unnamed protein product [Rotaria magnacalcarata]CAF1671133.1 unnamed protein product [Rotaria magnacalcarata]CAF2058566.1 unnamed protein product [Rotaria magnacalcarata]CAF2063295.1 unnamed protein product [Rotaria magnacalcarata]CAF2145461.1 unnamed protein product [Rotaria magnacalcarata]